LALPGSTVSFRSRTSQQTLSSLTTNTRGHQYVTLKVHEHDSGQDSREVRVYHYLNSLTTSHIGALLVRTSLDDFEISTPNGSYPCLVLPPLAMSLSQFRGKMPGKRMSEELLKTLLYHLLLALDFLHTEAQVIHTGKRSQVVV
jgi:serine/threonine-protein kinase SRPK3